MLTASCSTSLVTSAICNMNSFTLQVSIVDVLQEAYPFARDTDVAKMLGWISSAKPLTTTAGGLTSSAAASGSSSTKRLLPQPHLMQLAYADREEIVSTTFVNIC
jgi:hypothetical protein